MVSYDLMIFFRSNNKNDSSKKKEILRHFSIVEASFNFRRKYSGGQGGGYDILELVCHIREELHVLVMFNLYNGGTTMM